MMEEEKWKIVYVGIVNFTVIINEAMRMIRRLSISWWKNEGE